jgi:hypothetical protein
MVLKTVASGVSVRVSTKVGEDEEVCLVLVFGVLLDG